MVMKRVLFIIALIGCCINSKGEGEQKLSDWHFSGSVVYSSRSLGGVIVNKVDGNNGGYGDMVTTGDAMGVDDSNGAMLALGMQYKRFGWG